MLTKKHFKKIAEMINDNTSAFDLDKIDKAGFITDLENFLATTNPLFDREKFEKACYE